MYCPECGQKIPENSKFCPMCGLNLNEFYKNRYGQVNESPEKPKEDIEPEKTHEETREEKAKRFEQILKNAGRTKSSEDDLNNKKLQEDIKETEQSKDNKVSYENDIEIKEDDIDIKKDLNTEEDVDEDVEKGLENVDEDVSGVVEEVEDFDDLEEESDDLETSEESKEVDGFDDELEDHRRWEEDNLSRAREYMEENFEDGGSAKVKLGDINFKIMKFIHSIFSKTLEILAIPGKYYKDVFVILSTLFILVSNTNVIRKSSPTQTLSFNRFLITIVVSVGALAIIVLKPYLLMSFDKNKFLKPIKDTNKYANCVMFALVTSLMRLVFYILLDFVPGIGVILGYSISVKSFVLYIIFLILETLFLEGILKNSWKRKRDIKNFLITFLVVFVVESISILLFRPVITMMIKRL